MQGDKDLNTVSIAKAGINLSAVFNLSELPKALYSQIAAVTNCLHDYRQLILFASAGSDLWYKIQSSSSVKCEHPIDEYSVKIVNKYLAEHYPKLKYQTLYPSQTDFDTPIGLQQLGELAGWHHTSPLRVGINKTWGTWFAYRVLMVCDSKFKPTVHQKPVLEETRSPCNSCNDKPCISSCPVNAVRQQEFDLNLCIDYRASEQSLCKDRCIARMACPVAKGHQYSIEQIQYHYGRSLRIIEKMSRSAGKT